MHSSTSQPCFSEIWSFFCLLRWWRVLYIYSGFNIVLLYLYQLPINFSDMIRWIASFIGVFRISVETEGPDIYSGLFLVLFYIMVCRLFLCCSRSWYAFCFLFCSHKCKTLSICCKRV